MRPLCHHTVILETKDHLSLHLLTFIYKMFQVDIPINTKGGNISKNLFCVLDSRNAKQQQHITEIMHSMECIISESGSSLVEEDVDLFNGISASINAGIAPVKEAYYIYNGSDFNDFMRSSSKFDMLDLYEINKAFAQIDFWAAPANKPDKLVLIKSIH